MNHVSGSVSCRPRRRSCLYFGVLCNDVTHPWCRNDCFGDMMLMIDPYVRVLSNKPSPAASLLFVSVAAHSFVTHRLLQHGRFVVPLPVRLLLLLAGVFRPSNSVAAHQRHNDTTQSQPTECPGSVTGKRHVRFSLAQEMGVIFTMLRLRAAGDFTCQVGYVNDMNCT